MLNTCCNLHYRVNLFCNSTSSYGGCTDGACTVKLMGPIRMSTKRPTQSDCLRFLREQIRRDHGSDGVDVVQARQVASSTGDSTKRPVDEGSSSLNANDVMMLRAQLKSLEERSVIVNKSVLMVQKERDTLQK
jgi:hypothetical protein